MPLPPQAAAGAFEPQTCRKNPAPAAPLSPRPRHSATRPECAAGLHRRSPRAAPELQRRARARAVEEPSSRYPLGARVYKANPYFFQTALLLEPASIRKDPSATGEGVPGPHVHPKSCWRRKVLLAPSRGRRAAGGIPSSCNHKRRHCWQSRAGCRRASPQPLIRQLFQVVKIARIEEGNKCVPRGGNAGISRCRGAAVDGVHDAPQLRIAELDKRVPEVRLRCVIDAAKRHCSLICASHNSGRGGLPRRASASSRCTSSMFEPRRAGMTACCDSGSLVPKACARCSVLGKESRQDRPRRLRAAGSLTSIFIATSIFLICANPAAHEASFVALATRLRRSLAEKHAYRSFRGKFALRGIWL